MSGGGLGIGGIWLSVGIGGIWLSVGIGGIWVSVGIGGIWVSVWGAKLPECSYTSQGELHAGLGGVVSEEGAG